MGTHISVRIPEQAKEKLEQLSKITGMSLSDIIRDVVLTLAKIRVTVDAIETVEKLEGAVVEEIVRLQEFQGLLGKLRKFLETRKVAVGFGGEKIKEYAVLYCDYTVVHKDRWYPARIEFSEVCNEYGTCWTEGILIEQIKTLRELVEFIREAEQKVDDVLRYKIEEIKESIVALLK